MRDCVAGLYEREVTSEGVTRHIPYIAGGSGVVAIYTDERRASASAPRLRYLHKDHVGSVDAINDNNGTVAERLSGAEPGECCEPPKEGRFAFA